MAVKRGFWVSLDETKRQMIKDSQKSYPKMWKNDAPYWRLLLHSWLTGDQLPLNKREQETSLGWMKSWHRFVHTPSAWILLLIGWAIAIWGLRLGIPGLLIALDVLLVIIMTIIMPISYLRSKSENKSMG